MLRVLYTNKLLFYEILEDQQDKNYIQNRELGVLGER